MTRLIFGVDEPEQAHEHELVRAVESRQALLAEIDAAGHRLTVLVPWRPDRAGNCAWEQSCAVCGETITYNLIPDEEASAMVLTATFYERLLGPCRRNWLVTAEMPYRGGPPHAPALLAAPSAEERTDDDNP